MYKLFNEFGHRYDLHTPPSHYQHDHELVLQLAREQGLPCRMLDIGCGTGILVEKARAQGIDAVGIDASESMIQVAHTRVPREAARVQRMQELDDVGVYDLIVSMSWSIHYCTDEDEMRDVFDRIRRALKPGGRLLLQVAHGPNMTGEWMHDRECGPTGIASDVALSFRFRATGASNVVADYIYRCTSTREELRESHRLSMTNARQIETMLQLTGFSHVALWNSWRREPLAESCSALAFANAGVAPTL